MTSDISMKVPVLTRSGNYRTWAACMKALLTTQRRMDKLLSNKPLEPDQLELDEVCKATILLHVAGPLQAIVARASTAKEAWDSIREEFQGILVSRRPQVTAAMSSLHQGRKTLTEYIDAALAIKDDLVQLDMEAALPMLCDNFYQGLNSSLKYMCGLPAQQLLASNEDCLDSLCTLVKTMAPMAPSASDAGRAYKASALTCAYCNKPGHSEHNCRKKKRDEAARAAQEPSTSMPDLGAILSTRAVAQAIFSPASPKDFWLDSGASHHVVCDERLLTNTRPSIVTEIVLGGDEKHRVRCEGQMTVTGGPNGPVTFTGVLCVPTMSINLCSIRQMTGKIGRVEFIGTSARIISTRGECLLNAHLGELLYKLDCKLPGYSQAASNVTVCAETWHKRLGHISLSALRQMVSSCAVDGLGEVKFDSKSGSCDVCDKAKQTRESFPSSESCASTALGLVHCDVMGPFPCAGVCGEKFVVTILDDCTRFAEVVCLPSKGKAAGAVRRVLLRWERQLGQKVLRVRTDNGTEFEGELRRWMDDQGIIAEKSVAYTPEQNGRAERLNRTLIERTRALMYQHTLPKQLWSESMKTAAFLRNMVPTSGQVKSPHELFHGKKPDVSMLREYGCKVAVHVPKAQRDKLDCVSEEGALVGYAPFSKAYRVAVRGHNDELCVIEAISVRIHENETPAFLTQRSRCNRRDPPLEAEDLQYQPPDKRYDADYQPSHDEHQQHDLDIQERDVPPPDAPSDDESAYSLQHSLSSMSSDDSELQPSSEEPAGSAHDDAAEEASVAGYSATEDDSQQPDVDDQSISSHPIDVQQEEDVPNSEPVPDDGLPRVNIWEPPRRYPKRDRHSPRPWWRSQRARINAAAALTDEPQTYTEVMRRPDAELWDAAICEELSSLREKNVFETVDSVPAGMKPLPSKLVFNIKRDEHGNIDKYKCRLVAKGFRQIAGRDYDEVFAPTAQQASLRLLLAIAAQQELEVDQLDVKTAFLNGDLQGEVYLRLPKELGGQLWRLQKALYGLKQAARAWHDKLHQVMCAIGFTPSLHDPCLLFQGVGSDRVYVLVHVDDALVVGKSGAVKAAKRAIASKFAMKDLGAAKYYLGLEIRRASGEITLCQQHYAESVIKRFGMEDGNPKVTPLEVGLQLSKSDGDKLVSPTLFQEIIGSLMYLACDTRPDLSHSVSMLSRFMSAPTMRHLEASKRILRYLKGTVDYGIRFAKSEGQGVLLTFSDSDYAADVDKRRSTSGMVITYNGAAVMWFSKLQTVTAASTTEAEYISAASATKESLWLRKLLGEISGKSEPVHLFCDNQSTVELIKQRTAGRSGRSKHIDTQYHFIRTRYQRGELCIAHVESANQAADMLTKQLPGPAYKIALNRIMGVDGSI